MAGVNQSITLAFVSTVTYKRKRVNGGHQQLCMDVSIGSQYTSYYDADDCFHHGYRTDTGNLYIPVVIKRRSKHIPDNDYCKSGTTSCCKRRKQPDGYFTCIICHAKRQLINGYNNKLCLDTGFWSQYVSHYDSGSCNNNCNRINSGDIFISYQ